jgi:hypothetical protein
MKRIMVLVVAVFVATTTEAQIPQELTQASVLVRTEKGTGSGVVFNNGDHTFVWTNGHVVASCQKVKTVIDPATGQPAVRVTYNDVDISTEIYEDGRKMGETALFAEILRYSPPVKGGYDLALLRLYKKKAYPASVTFLPDGTIPEEGVKLWHVGSMAGRPGQNAVSEGVFAKAGRLRGGQVVNEHDEPVIFDQISVPSYFGASGGGYFLQTKPYCCAGLMTEAFTDATSINFMVPARRITEFARLMKCEWAVTTKVEAPKDPNKLKKVHPSHLPIPLPDDWKKPLIGTGPPEPPIIVPQPIPQFPFPRR